MTTNALTSTVACPLCGMAVGRHCETKSGYFSSIHKVRWKAAGVSDPTWEEKCADAKEWDRIAEDRRVAHAKERTEWWDIQKAKGSEFAAATVAEYESKAISLSVSDLASMVKAQVVPLGAYSEKIAQEALGRIQ